METLMRKLKNFDQVGIRVNKRNLPTLWEKEKENQCGKHALDSDASSEWAIAQLRKRNGDDTH